MEFKNIIMIDVLLCFQMHEALVDRIIAARFFYLCRYAFHTRKILCPFTLYNFFCHIIITLQTCGIYHTSFEINALRLDAYSRFADYALKCKSYIYQYLV